MKGFLQKNREYFTVAAISVLVFSFMIAHKIPCPIKHLTGLSCAGCGMTRAFLSALSLDFSAAFNYHPLWISLIPLAALLIVLKSKQMNKAFSLTLVIAATIFFAVWIYRLSAGDSVVAFDFEESVINKIVKKIAEL